MISDLTKIFLEELPILEISAESPQTISWGETVLFQCLAVAGVPSPVLTWTRTDLRPLTSNTEVLPGGVLRISKATGEEEGEYSCRAENSAGSKEERLKLIVITEGELLGLFLFYLIVSTLQTPRW